MSSPSDAAFDISAPPQDGRTVHVVVGGDPVYVAALLGDPGAEIVSLEGDARDARRLLELAARSTPVVYWPWPNGTNR